MSAGEEELRRFAAARMKVLTPEHPDRRGIGMQSEKTLHSILKYYIEPDESFHEQPVARYIADIKNEAGITEVQTAGYGYLRGKLSVFLKDYPVTVVCPVVHVKHIQWIDPESGEWLKRNRSPVTGGVFTAFTELYRIRPFLKDPRLTVRVILMDMEEYRIADGYAREGKKGSHRFDRVPCALISDTRLRTPEDYRGLIPDSLPEEFTSADFAGHCRVRKGESGTALLILTDLGAVRRIGKKGRSYLYQRTM